MGMPRCFDMNLYEYNRSLTRLLIVSHANTPVRPSNLVSEEMPIVLYKSLKNEALGDDLEHQHEIK